MFKSKLFHIFLSTFLLVFLNASFAAALVEQAGDADNPPSKMWLQGTKMRVQMTRAGQYMLMDLGKKKMYVVNPANKIVLDNSEVFKQKKARTDDLKINVKHMGNGPVIAGYPTQKYSLSVNGQLCEQVLVSKKAMKDTGMLNMMEAMTSINMNPTGPDMRSKCDRAEGLFATRMKKLGIPMGIIKDGQVKADITRIVPNASLPAHAFDLPKGYKVLTMQQYMMQMMRKRMPQH